VATDWRGYTVKTQLNPYDENRVAIDNDYFSEPTSSSKTA
jgi:outer membrane usher protein